MSKLNRRGASSTARRLRRRSSASASARRCCRRRADAAERRRAGAAFRGRSVLAEAAAQHWLLGMTIGVWVDEQDHVWIIHRSSATLHNNEKGAELSPPIAECCRGAPPVLVFDPAGNLVRSWGGPGEGYEWPQSNHGIHVDHKGNVWIGGNGEKDAHILKFTKDGKFLLQVGGSGKNAGSNDHENFGRVAKIWVDPKTNEAYIADGYLNKRVAVLDADTGKMKRYWGAYGNKPDDANLGPYDPKAPPAQQFRNPVHCVERSERRAGLCLRPRQQPPAGLHPRRQVREGGVLRQEHARLRLGLGHRVLARPASSATSSSPTARTRRCAIILRETLEELTHVRRRRPPARPVLRRAQHRHGFQGQPLHDRHLRGKTRAEIRLQGHRQRARGSQGVLWPRT